MMLYSGTDPESYITEHTLVYEDNMRVAQLRMEVVGPDSEGRCKATWKRKSKLPGREAGPPNHHDDKVDSDQ